MNQVIETIHNRKSTRAFEPQPVPPAVRDQLIQATMRAPTAGNMMLYSIIEVQDQALKDQLVETCDNQPFIAEAPLVLLFLADYQRWFDYFHHAGVKEHLLDAGQEIITPQPGDLMLAACDALIAAQTAVLAAEALGLSSCYIGDILENYETHIEMFDLPPYALPVALLCIGYPTEAERKRQKTTRFGEEFILFHDRYRRLSDEDFGRMFGEQAVGEDSPGVMVYRRKYSAGFSIEMRRSVQAMLDSLSKA
jgi:FMN reductase (NADPH)/FMN reductase [NAD(P)H]